MLIEHWNGNAWSVMTNPTVTGNPQTDLRGVACILSMRFFFVGSIVLNPLAHPVGRHTVEAKVLAGCAPAPLPGGVERGDLPQPDELFRSGRTRRQFSSPIRTLIMRWSGDNWSVMGTPIELAGETLNVFGAISCPTITTCFAVGHTDTKTLVERWTSGTAWTRWPAPMAPVIPARWLGFVLTSTTSCIAVGWSTSATAAVLPHRDLEWHELRGHTKSRSDGCCLLATRRRVLRFERLLLRSGHAQTARNEYTLIERLA